VIAGHLDRHVRAYAKSDGKLLWDFDTGREFETVNGMKGHGGGMSGPGAAVGDGYVVINSGYGLYYHEPGNVLLVFGRKNGA
jgi:polyvinyl alcohol dehydrogenase (cytochrome)